jgi:hypothetical protein
METFCSQRVQFDGNCISTGQSRPFFFFFCQAQVCDFVIRVTTGARERRFHNKRLIIKRDGGSATKTLVDDEELCLRRSCGWRLSHAHVSSHECLNRATIFCASFIASSFIRVCFTFFFFFF